MVGICFFFEPNDTDVWSGRRIDLDAWNYAAKMAGDITRLFVINRTDAKLTTPDAALDFRVFDEPVTLEGEVAWLCCPWNIPRFTHPIPLWYFDHKVDWYLFGPSEGWRFNVDGLGVFVPQASQGALHSVHIASIVMAHRFKEVAWR